jgi:hypothetical protein
LSTSADWDLCRRIASAYKVYFVREPLIAYRIHSVSMHQNVNVFEHDMLIAFRKLFSDPASAAVHHLRRRAYARLFLIMSGTFLAVRNVPRSLVYLSKAFFSWPPSVSYAFAWPVRHIRRRSSVPELRLTV